MISHYKKNNYIFILSIICFLYWHHSIAQPLNELEISRPSVNKDKGLLSAVDGFFVSRIDLQGNSIFSRQALESIITAYEGRLITSEELHELARKLTSHYLQSGYVNSGVVIPDQRVENGIVTLQVIEGRLAEVEIKDKGRLRSSYIKKRIHIDENRVFNIKELQTDLRRLERDPRIKRVIAQLKPTERKGHAILEMDIEEKRPYHIYASWNNKLSPNVGGQQGQLNLSHINLSGFGDSVYTELAAAEGLQRGLLSYTAPITSNNAFITFNYEQSKSEVVVEPFVNLDISGESRKYGFDLQYPLYDNLKSEFYVGLSGSKRQSKSFLLGQLYPFSPGSVQGRTQATVLGLSQRWVRRRTNSVLALYSNFDFGVNPSDKVENDAPDGKFNIWSLQLHWLQRIPLWESLFVLRTRSQLSKDKLLAFEQFSLGGSESVRGYRENFIIRDNGVIATLEWRIPLVRSARLSDGSKSRSNVIEFVTFFDYGEGWNNNDNMPDDRQSIASLGAGIRWRPRPPVFFNIDFAFPLNNGFDDINRSNDRVETSIQDDGIHFNVGVEF